MTQWTFPLLTIMHYIVKFIFQHQTTAAFQITPTPHQQPQQHIATSTTLPACLPCPALPCPACLPAPNPSPTLQPRLRDLSYPSSTLTPTTPYVPHKGLRHIS